MRKTLPFEQESGKKRYVRPVLLHESLCTAFHLCFPLNPSFWIPRMPVNAKVFNVLSIVVGCLGRVFVYASSSDFACHRKHRITLDIVLISQIESDGPYADATEGNPRERDLER